MVQWLRLHAPNAGVQELDPTHCKEDPTRATKTWHSQIHFKKQKAKTEYKLFQTYKDPEK